MSIYEHDYTMDAEVNLKYTKGFCMLPYFNIHSFKWVLTARDGLGSSSQRTYALSFCLLVVRLRFRFLATYLCSHLDFTLTITDDGIWNNVDNEKRGILNIKIEGVRRVAFRN